jgi:putative ABC transport system permease protein
VFLFSLFISLTTGVIFGLAPAWHASKVNLSEALNADSRTGTAVGRHRTLGLLVIAEVALAVILLSGAELMFQSFLRLQAVDPGSAAASRSVRCRRMAPGMTAAPDSGNSTGKRASG